MVKTEGVFNARSTEVAICEQLIYQPERKRKTRDSIHTHYCIPNYYGSIVHVISYNKTLYRPLFFIVGIIQP